MIFMCALVFLENIHKHRKISMITLRRRKKKAGPLSGAATCSSQKEYLDNLEVSWVNSKGNNVRKAYIQ